LEGYAAVAIQSLRPKDKAYGVIWFTARTEVDKVNRLVTLDDFSFTRRSFPMLANNGSQYLPVLQVMPSMSTIALDLLETSLTLQTTGDQKTYQLENEEPNIIFSSTPAVLALIDGQPEFRPASGNLQIAINTRALMVFDPARQMYYLALMDGWVQAPARTGEWSVTAGVSTKSLDRLRRIAELTGRHQILGEPDQSLKQTYEEGQAPAVYVRTVPTELLLSHGPPQFTPIIGTSLLYVENSGNDIFMDNFTQSFYALVSGRWFTSDSLQNGPWSYVTPADLPSDFAEIPAYSPKANVLVSVPGTPQSVEALIANQIPQTATISRDMAKLHMKYYGAPDFQLIEGTHLRYAINSTTPIISVPGSNMFYAIKNAVWFSSPDANGPWTAATSVPSEIYTIPPSSPIHFVTYVQIYGYTPTKIYTGYTPGYYGTVASWDNVVVYGTGWNYPPYVDGANWVPRVHTYGVGSSLRWSVGAGWSLEFGRGMKIGGECSPWWEPLDAGGWGFAMPVKGWNAHGGAASANIYRRWRNTVYAGTHAVWATPPGEHVKYRGNYTSPARSATYNGRTGNDRTGLGWHDRNSAADSSDHLYSDHDLYADHDGNVYRASPGSGWQQHTSHGWSTLANGATRPFLDNWRSARALGDQRWSNLRSHGWDGSGSGSFADR
jgi:hypothetical protein